MTADIDAALDFAIKDTSTDFGTQLVKRRPHNNAEANVLALARAAFGTSAYALVDRDGRPVEIEPLRQSVQAYEGMKDVAWQGRAWFVAPGPGPRASLRLRSTLLRSFVEGYRLSDFPFAEPRLAYWRLYENGLAVTAATYDEDAPSEFLNALHGGAVTIVPRFLDATHTIWRLHSLLAHARFVGEQVDGVERVLVQLEWVGLNGRRLLHCGADFAGFDQPDGILRPPVIDIRWSDLSDHYTDQVARVANQVFGCFAQPSTANGLADAHFVRDELGRFKQPTVRPL